MEKEKSNKYLKYDVKVSFLELYNEELRDMLATSQKELSIHEDSTGIYVSGLTEEYVSNQQVLFIRLFYLHSSGNGKCSSSRFRKSNNWKYFDE